MRTCVVQVLDLRVESPPIRSNDKAHWAAKAKQVKELRTRACLLARANLVPMAGPVRVTLAWVVTDRRRRDAGASAPTLKAVLDGIVDAGVLPGDDSQVVVSEECRVEQGRFRAVYVRLEQL